jgi:hypothetical protein
VVGDVLKVGPGDQIVVDGRVIGNGQSAVMAVGESLLIAWQPLLVLVRIPLHSAANLLSLWLLRRSAVLSAVGWVSSAPRASWRAWPSGAGSNAVPGCTVA